RARMVSGELCLPVVERALKRLQADRISNFPLGATAGLTGNQPYSAQFYLANQAPLPRIAEVEWLGGQSRNFGDDLAPRRPCKRPSPLRPHQMRHDASLMIRAAGK